MKKYFLENTLELSAADTIYTVCCKEVTKDHKSYLEKMGFVKENSVYVKNA
mgnify:CR=1 FL=1